MGVGHAARGRGVRGRPLLGTGGAPGQHPFVLEQDVEVIVVPLDRVRGPGAFNAAADGVHALTRAKAVLPAEALILDGGAFGFGADILARIGRAVALAEGVSAGNQR